MSLANQKYIFGNLTKETFFFGLPILFTGLFFILLPKETDLTIAIPFIVVALQMIDSGHIWPSMVIAFGKKKNYSWEGTLYLLIPLGVALIYFILGVQYGKLGIYRAHAYFAGFHFIRQQYGIMRLSESLNPTCKEIYAHIDNFIIYTITILSVLGRSSNEGRWMRDGDLISIDSSYFPYFVNMFAGLVVFYFVMTFYKWLVHKEFSMSKVLLFTNAAIAWGVIGFTKYPALILFPLFHDLPYLGLAFNYENKVYDTFRSSLAKFFKNVKWALLGIFLIVFLVFGSSLEIYMFQVFDRENFLTGYFGIFLVALAFLPTTTHYFIDAFLWRRGIVPKNILDFKP